jgi:ankyrin repeat protein
MMYLYEKSLIPRQANPKLADQKDDDERLPIHWATSYGHLEIAKMLAAQKNFDPDVQVGLYVKCFVLL